MKCNCANPDPIEVTDETFEGLFDEIPVVALVHWLCGRCGRPIDNEVPDEFDDDDETCDFDDEVIT